MKKNIKTTLIALFALLPLGMQAQQSVVTKDRYEGTQILNSDFETWGTEYENVPVGWHSFESVDGSSDLFINFAKSTAHTEKETGHKRESSCLLLKPRTINVIIKKVLANGTITTGRMYAGATDADDSKNHAEMDVNNDGSSNGSPFYSLLNSKPTALAVWLKFISNDTSNPCAKVSAVITNGTYYQDPEDKTYTNVYAKAQQSIVSNGGDWQRVVIPFTVQDEDVNPVAILMTLSTNATPGGGDANDKLYVDDLELIYTHEIEIPASGYATFTNTVMKNHKVVMPEGLKGYALAVNAGGEPYITDTLEAGDVLPYNATLLLEGKATNYTFSTTLYDEAKAVPATVDEGLVPASELNNPLDGYKYFYLAGEGTTLAFRKAATGLKIQDDKALLRVKADKAADSYQHILFTPELTGDINDDGQQSIADITALVNRLLGKQEQSSKLFIPSADVNGDSSTTISDVTELVNILLGKSN